MLLLKMGPEVPSRARSALPALRKSEKEGGRRSPKFSRIFKLLGVLTRMWMWCLCLLLSPPCHYRHSTMTRTITPEEERWRRVGGGLNTLTRFLHTYLKAELGTFLQTIPR